MRGTQELPEGWVWTRLGDVIDKIVNGISKRQVKEKVGLPVTRIETISTGKINLEKVGYLKDLTPELIEKYKLLYGDILFSNINSDFHLGKTAVYNYDDITLLHGMNLLLLRPTKNVLSSDFLHYLCNYLRFSGLFISIAQHAVNQSSINQTKMKNIEIPLPPLHEQHRIVTKIEELFTRLDAGVGALKKVKVELNRYRQSVLKAAMEGKLTDEWREAHKGELEPASVLLERIKEERRKKLGEKYKEPAPVDTSKLPKLLEGWVWVRLDTIAQLKGGITKNEGQKLDDAQMTPYLRVANVQRGYLDLTEMKEIMAPKDKIEQLLLESGDILFTEGGDRDKLGRGWIWEGQLSKCIHQNHVFRARPYSKEISSKLISWYGNTFGQSYFMREGKQTTNLASINLTKLSEFPVPLPSKEERETIVKEIECYLSFIDKMEKTVDQSLKRAQRLRQSILQKAFEGNLVPQDPDDEPASVLLERIKAEKARRDADGKRAGNKVKKAVQMRVR